MDPTYSTPTLLFCPPVDGKMGNLAMVMDQMPKENNFKVLTQIQDTPNRALKGHKHIFPERYLRQLNMLSLWKRSYTETKNSYNKW